MTKQDAIEWINYKFNSCYPVVHSEYPNRLFMLYDEQITRKIKLSKISGRELKVSNVRGKCLFDLNYDTNFFYYDYETIWLFLHDNYSPYNNDIYSIMKDWLLYFDIMNNNYIPIVKEFQLYSIDFDKMSILSPYTSKQSYRPMLFENNKLKIL